MSENYKKKQEELKLCVSIRLIDDLNHVRLVGERDESTIQMVTLALTGRALHYFHNGVIDVDSEGNLMVRICVFFSEKFNY